MPRKLHPPSGACATAKLQQPWHATSEVSVCRGFVVTLTAGEWVLTDRNPVYRGRGFGPDTLLVQVIPVNRGYGTKRGTLEPSTPA